MTNNPETILPDSVAIFKNIAAFDQAAALWIESLQLEKILVYLVEQVDARALPLLAEQLDVLGYKGLRLAATEADQRNLIKRAIELHRYKGTRWAVQEAMKSIGFTDAVIQEHVNGHWANFKVQLFNQSVPITTESIQDLHAMISEYKNARSNLVEIFLEFGVDEDALDLTGDDAGIAEDINIEDPIVFTGGLLYDGTGEYDGSHDHSADADLITFQQI